MPANIANRMRRLRAELRLARAAALLVSHRPNLFYLSNFTGDNGILLVETDRAVLFTDPRFTTQAREECSGRHLRIVITRKALLEEAGRYLSPRGRSGKILFEEDKLSVYRARKIQRFLSQPFNVAKVFTGQDGKIVPLKDTIRGFKAIIAGEYDHLPEQAFYMIGGIEEAVEKAKTLA